MKVAKGEIGFDEFYRRQWRERWETLRDSLQTESAKEKLLNPFHAEDSKLQETYELDPAAVIAARNLEVQKGDRVLDMCAAPGAKSLVSVFALRGDAEWVLNDLSFARVKKLKKVIKEYVPAAVQTRIKITNHDASRWGVHEKDFYDRVLLDAPCSAERQLLEKKSELQSWSETRSKGLKQRQYSLLSAGMTALKPGGRLVYTTCSISKLENDEVIERFLTRKDGTGKIIHPGGDIGERTAYGRIILPDAKGRGVTEGAGPVYFCILEKK